MKINLIYFLCTILLGCNSNSSSDSNPPNTQQTFLQCISEKTPSDHPISNVVYTPDNSSYTSVLQSYIRNLRFTSPSTPKPLCIITPTHESHIQSSIQCSKHCNLQIRIRSGGHDYDGLSYISDVPFVIIDMSNLRSVDIDLDDGTMWVQSGATLGEVYRRIARETKLYGFPAGVCPTVGVGGHFSGGGYGNMMRRFGLSVDNVVDAILVDVNGRVLNRELMGEDLFWAVRGGGGASFGVIVSWKIKLVPVPEIVTVFRVEKTLEEGAGDIVYRWQYVADTIDEDLFIRVVVMPSVKKDHKSVKAKFNALFLGSAENLVRVMNEKFPEFGLKGEDCVEMSWIESVLFWSNYPRNASIDVLLERIPKSENFLKKKSDYVQEPISKEGLEGLWKVMMELKKPALTFNPYGGKMSEISESITPFPHREGNIYKIQYSINWKEGGDEAADHSLSLIRRVYEYMTPYVSKSPRGAYLNYRDVDLGTNNNTNGGDEMTNYMEARKWGTKYFKGNFDRLVHVKTMVDPDDFFRYEQSIPTLKAWKSVMSE